MIGIADLGLKAPHWCTDRTEYAESYLTWTPLQFLIFIIFQGVRFTDSTKSTFTIV